MAHDADDRAELSVRAWPALARAHVMVRGALGAESRAALLRAVADAMKPDMLIALDLADVTRLDDDGILAILECRERATRGGAALEIQDPSPSAHAALTAWERRKAP
jgi:ABC-type transporter Mla MlaB component